MTFQERFTRARKLGFSPMYSFFAAIPMWGAILIGVVLGELLYQIIKWSLS